VFLDDEGAAALAQLPAWFLCDSETAFGVVFGKRGHCSARFTHLAFWRRALAPVALARRARTPAFAAAPRAFAQRIHQIDDVARLGFGDGRRLLAGALRLDQFHQRVFVTVLEFG